MSGKGRGGDEAGREASKGLDPKAQPFLVNVLDRSARARSGTALAGSSSDRSESELSRSKKRNKGSDFNLGDLVLDDVDVESTGLNSLKVQDRNPLIWIDLEMTGLAVEEDTVLEIACLVSSGDLRVMYRGPNIAIHHGGAVLNNMNAWSTKQHAESGLTERCRSSKVALDEAEGRVVEFITAHLGGVMKAQLAGNSVHQDLLFIKKYMPRLAARLDYRIVE